MRKSKRRSALPLTSLLTGYLELASEADKTEEKMLKKYGWIQSVPGDHVILPWSQFVEVRDVCNWLERVRYQNSTNIFSAPPDRFGNILYGKKIIPKYGR